MSTRKDKWNREELGVAVLLGRGNATPGVNRVRQLECDVDLRTPRISGCYTSRKVIHDDAREASVSVQVILNRAT